MERLSKKDIGRKLTFKSCCRSGFVKATRILKGVTPDGGAIVRYNGWDNFIVRIDELISIN